MTKYPLTEYLAPQLAAEPFVLVDVGASWGIDKRWLALGDSLRAFCFEADHKECDNQNASAPDGVRYIPEVIAGKNGVATLYQTKLSFSSGLYRVNDKFFKRLLNHDNATVCNTRTVTTKTMDMVREEYGIPEIDFLKLDVEGAELDILRAMDLSSTYGIYTEFRFHHCINGSPVFAQMDDYLRAHGFMLFDIEVSRQSRRALPYPGPKLSYTNGERLYVETERGQVMDGNALYLRDPLLFTMSREQILKAACVFELFDLKDCAAELLIMRHDEADVDQKKCLDLLAGGDYEKYLEAY